MTKSELIAAVKAKTGFTNNQAFTAVDAVFAVIADELANGGKINVQKFGTFEVRQRAAREGINPRTKAKIPISASKTPAFKPSYKLKQRVNK